MEDMLLIKKSFALLFIILLTISLLIGCRKEENNDSLIKDKSDLNYAYNSVKLFVQNEDKNLYVTKDEKNNLITIVDNSITKGFIEHQRLAIKLNGYKEIRHKWDVYNNALIDRIENYKYAMDILGYEVNFSLLRCDKDTNENYYYCVNGNVIYDRLFELIGF